MKKVVLILMFFLLFFNFSYANDFIYTWTLSEKNQIIYKKQIDKVFTKLIEKFSSNSNKKIEKR